MRISADDILKKYRARIEKEMKGFDSSQAVQKFSKSYEQFRKSMIPSFSRYEKWCKSLGSIFHVKVGEKEREKIRERVEFVDFGSAGVR